jgi:RND family efflux transporter MFP subunit
MTPGLDIKSLSLRGERDANSQVAPRRHILARYVLPLGLIVGFVALMAWSARNAWLPRHPVTVVPVHVSRAELRTAGTPLFKAAGWIEPRPTPIRVAALATGVVEKLLVVEDQAVAAGEPIAQLIDKDARIDLSRAEAHLEILKTDVPVAEAALAAATTNLNVPAHLEAAAAEAEAALREVETELSNLPNHQARAAARHTLAEIDLAAKQKAGPALAGLAVKQSQAEFDAAAAEVRELEQRLPVLQQRREALVRRHEAAQTRLRLKTDEVQAKASAEAKLCAAHAHVTEAQAALEAAQLRLERMTVRAPVSGRILDLVAAPGSQMMEGFTLSEGRDSNTVVTMYCPDQLQVRTDVRFEDLPRVGRDQPVEVRSPALPEPLRGKVLFLTGSANIQKNTLEVKVSIEQPPEVLKPEMLVDVTFLAPEQPATEEKASDEFRLFVPASLVESSGDTHAVWVADATELVAHRKIVTLGPVRTPTLVEVVSGLDASSRLIATGREGLEEGMRIAIQGEERVPELDATAPPHDMGAMSRHPK